MKKILMIILLAIIVLVFPFQNSEAEINWIWIDSYSENGQKLYDVYFDENCKMMDDQAYPWIEGWVYGRIVFISIIYRYTDYGVKVEQNWPSPDCTSQIECFLVNIEKGTYVTFRQTFFDKNDRQKLTPRDWPYGKNFKQPKLGSFGEKLVDLGIKCAKSKR